MLIKNVIIDASNEKKDLLIEGARIKKIARSLEIEGEKILEGGGRVLLPGLVESHIHLDKALISDRMPNRSGTLEEALRVTAKLKPTFTREDIEDRARRALDMIISRGTSYVRTHAEFDPLGGFDGFETIMKLKHEYKDLIDMQVVAFPQEGIIKAPGTEEMMYGAMDMGADLVGAVPYNDVSAQKHIDLVFEIAKKYDKDLDLHQDFRDYYQGQSIDYLARKTIAEGYQGRVSVGHLTSLGAMPDKELEPILELLYEARINVMALPMTDLHLGGRGDEYNVRRALTPIRKLRDAGINVVLATNNIRNPFTPYGNGDLIQVAMLAIPVAHLGGEDDLASVLPMITDNAARALGIKGYGIKEGGRADLVLFDTKNYQNLIIDIPERLKVIKAGKLIYEASYEKKKLY